MMIMIIVNLVLSRHVTELSLEYRTTWGRAKPIFCFLDLMAITNESQHEKFSMEIINTSKNPA
jgi:hypothetical protein